MKLPKDFNVPNNIKSKDFLFRKLTTRDVYLDYLAVMSSIDIIQKTRGGSWPTKELTFEEDLIDLGWHQKEFEDKSTFAYTVFSPDNTKCLGCFYLYDAGTRKEVDSTYDVDVSFWVTQEAYDKGMYKMLYTEIRKFLKQWPFEKPCFSNDVLPE